MEALLEHPVQCYIFAVALQMSGAIILILYFCGKTKDRILKEYFPGSNTVERDENNKVILDKGKIRNCAAKIYMNRLAVIYIAFGYLVGIYGSIEACSADYVLIMVILISCIFVIAGQWFSIIFSSIIYREDWKLDYDEISDIADTFATDAEIDEIFKDDF